MTTASPRGFGGTVRQEKSAQKPSGFTGTSPESRSLPFEARKRMLQITCLSQSFSKWYSVNLTDDI